MMGKKCCSWLILLTFLLGSLFGCQSVSDSREENLESSKQESSQEESEKEEINKVASRIEVTPGDGKEEKLLHLRYSLPAEICTEDAQIEFSAVAYEGRIQNEKKTVDTLELDWEPYMTFSGYEEREYAVTGNPVYMSVTVKSQGTIVGYSVIKIYAVNTGEKVEWRKYEASLVGESFILKKDGTREGSLGEVQQQIAQMMEKEPTQNPTVPDAMLPEAVQTVYRYKAEEETTPQNAAYVLAEILFEDMKKEADERTFRITKYKDLAVSITAMQELSAYEKELYCIREEEIKDSIWLVDISAQYQWEGFLDPLGEVPSSDYWAKFMVGSAAERLYRLVWDGEEYTLQTRREP